jgi:hypothetical protein
MTNRFMDESRDEMALSLRSVCKQFIMKDQNKNNLQRSQQGSGSAENTGRDRNEQKNRTANLGREEKQDIGHSAGVDNKDVADISDLGGLSGRDDYAGGDADEMSNQSTNERTER